MKVLILTDNFYLYNEMLFIVGQFKDKQVYFEFKFSFNNDKFLKIFAKEDHFLPLNIKNDYNLLINKYDVIISLHCKQIFPSKLVNSVRCINVHPGFNPYNRGWFPQVFSIINKMPCGVTIHEMNECIDDGAVIIQEQVTIYEWDTSLTAYTRILEKEVELLKKYLPCILNKDYQLTKPRHSGNLNSISNFKDLCELDINKQVSLKEAIDLLRALSHGDYKNAYYKVEGGIVFLSLNLEFIPNKEK